MTENKKIFIVGELNLVDRILYLYMQKPEFELRSSGAVPACHQGLQQGQTQKFCEVEAIYMEYYTTI
jgi:hypothetical protein